MTGVDQFISINSINKMIEVCPSNEIEFIELVKGYHTDAYQFIGKFLGVINGFLEKLWPEEKKILESFREKAGSEKDEFFDINREQDGGIKKDWCLDSEVGMNDDQNLMVEEPLPGKANAYPRNQDGASQNQAEERKNGAFLMDFGESDNQYTANDNDQEKSCDDHDWSMDDDDNDNAGINSNDDQDQFESDIQKAIKLSLKDSSPDQNFRSSMINKSVAALKAKVFNGGQVGLSNPAFDQSRVGCLGQDKAEKYEFVNSVGNGQKKRFSFKEKSPYTPEGGPVKDKDGKVSIFILKTSDRDRNEFEKDSSGFS
jgi:hypothetical protein